MSCGCRFVTVKRPPPDELGRRAVAELLEVIIEEFDGGTPSGVTVTAFGGRVEPNSSARPLLPIRLTPYAVPSSEGRET